MLADWNLVFDTWDTDVTQQQNLSSPKSKRFNRTEFAKWNFIKVAFFMMTIHFTYTHSRAHFEPVSYRCCLNGFQITLVISMGGYYSVLALNTFQSEIQFKYLWWCMNSNVLVITEKQLVYRSVIWNCKGCNSSLFLKYNSEASHLF